MKNSSNPLAVIALGGNAIMQNGGTATIEEQLAGIGKTLDALVDLLGDGFSLVITHGNGPQVGNLLVRTEEAKELLPPESLDVLGAETQGALGYMIAQSLSNALARRNLKRQVVAVVTQTVVQPNDPAFTEWTKPVGPFYSLEEARRLAQEKGHTLVEDSGRGYRRVVASPRPIRIVEKEAILSLVDAGFVTVAVGGGGAPVVEGPDGSLRGVPAVIDKDWASSKLAQEIEADYLVILTGVEKVAVNFGQPDQRELDQMDVPTAEEYARQGHFAPGSMLPKVQASIDFVSHGSGQAVITSIDCLHQALAGQTGTRITR